MRHEIVIHLSDLKRLFLRILPQIKIAAVLSAGFIFVFVLLREPQYIARASFKQASVASNESAMRLKELFQVSGLMSNQGSALSVMQSRTVMRGVVEELGLQITYEPSGLFTRMLGTIWDSLAAEIGGSLTDLDPFRFHQVKYLGEKRACYFVKLIDANHFELLDADQKLLGKWQVGQTFSTPLLTGILTQVPKGARINRLYRLMCDPWNLVVDAMKRRLEIKPFRWDSNLLSLAFAHRDRQLASAFLNELMTSYQRYMRTESQEAIGVQREYLESRQEELTREWGVLLEEHAAYLQENIGSQGYLSSNHQMDMLSEPHSLFASKLFDVDLELKRLEERSFETHEMIASHSPKAMRGYLKDKQSELSVQLAQVDHNERQLSIQPLLSHADPHEFAGLTLDTAQQLYLTYNTSRDQLQAQLKQLMYLSKEILSPDFELSSVTHILSDPVTHDLVHKASQTAVLLRDAHNRSHRELEHLRETLETQRTFLMHHLDQTIELTRLQLQQIEEKIGSLQYTTIELLKGEKHLIQQKLAEIGGKMEDLPEKWRRENLLLLKKELGTKMIEGLTQLAESKNIEQNLYEVTSKPLDLSLSPTQPKRPHLFLFSLIAGFFGALIFYFYQLCRGVFLGLPATHETLRGLGFRSLGILTGYSESRVQELQESDLETLRRTCQFILSQNVAHPCCAIVGKASPSFAWALSQLMSMQGMKVLVVSYVFDEIQMCDQPGLWQYLQGELEDLPIRSKEYADYLPSGDATRYGAEMLSNPKMRSFLNDVKKKYDLVLIYSKASAGSAEAQAFLPLADMLVIAVGEETREELVSYQQGEGKRAVSAFVCSH